MARYLVFSIVVALLLPACLDDRCGPNQMLVGIECKTIASDLAPTFDSESSDLAPTSDSESMDQVIGDCDKSTFGQSCTNDNDCTGDSDICALKPGDSEGYCSIYCDPNNDQCPTGFSCFDLTIFDPSLYAFCSKN